MIKEYLMKTISREELMSRLNRHEQVQLVMALGQWAYEQVHIPGSLNLTSPAEALGRLSPEQEVVVYCMNENCPASYRLYYHLKNLGFQKVTRFAGGIEAWAEAGFPVEGTRATETGWTYV